MKVLKFGENQLGVTIPYDLAKLMEIERGDELVFSKIDSDTMRVDVIRAPPRVERKAMEEVMA